MDKLLDSPPLCTHFQSRKIVAVVGPGRQTDMHFCFLGSHNQRGKEVVRREKGKRLLPYGKSYGKFRRELTLPTDVDQDKIDAVCKDGVLSITLPKAEKTKAVKVKVKG